jgi:site-specific DNA-methyltransferase (adenine-specific)
MLILKGDCREKVKSIPPSSVAAVCSDPPYELNFMSKSWDSSGVAFDPTLYTQLYRVLKPGGLIMAFSATRTFHRLCQVIDQTGFVDLKVHAWCYGSGFPKSLNISKAIEKKLGNKVKVVKTALGTGLKDLQSPAEVITYTSKEAKKWEGYGTALKPAWEPVVIASKMK